MIDWHSWRSRLLGTDLTVDLTDDTVRWLEQEGWVRRRLGRYCLTAAGHRALEDAMWRRVKVRLDDGQRHATALRAIAAAYPGERDYPGVLARRALGSNHDALRYTLYPIEEDR